MKIIWPSRLRTTSTLSVDLLSTLDGLYDSKDPGAQTGEHLRPQWPEEIQFGDGTVPCLPSSRDRCIQLIDQWRLGNIAMIGDPDRLAQRIGAIEDISRAETVVASIPGPRGWQQKLRHVSAGTRIIARVRAPFDGWWSDSVIGADVQFYGRDAEHYVLPGPLVLDGGGDHWVVDGFKAAPAIEPLQTFRDFDVLDRAKCHISNLRQFAESVAKRWMSPVAYLDVHETQESVVLHQFFKDASGFTATLRPTSAHLLITFTGYDAALETTVLGSVQEHFGSDATRTRPLRNCAAPLEPQAMSTTSRLPALSTIDLTLHPNAVATGEPVHLADGIVFSIGQTRSHLIDLCADDRVRIELATADLLDELTLGHELVGRESAQKILLDAGIAALGSPRPDAILRRHLSQLDRPHLSQLSEPMSPRIARAYHATLDAHARRKRFFEPVGQCPVLPETALRRSLLIGEAQEQPLRVLCLGDDDLVSVPLAALGHTVTVFDIDDFVLALVQNASRSSDLDISTAQVDLRNPVSPSHRNAFDVVLTDPMSNRACFELFLSRALACLAPGGRLFSACFPPTTLIFRGVCKDMKLPIVRWRARFNRYYNHQIQQTGYESDWVELSVTEDSGCAVAAEELSVSADLYREDFYQRPPIWTAEIDNIENTHLTRPLYFDLLFDTIETESDFRFAERRFHAAENWSLASAQVGDGRISLLADRVRNTLVVEMFPMIPELESRLRASVLKVFKPESECFHVVTSDPSWTLRMV